MLSRAILYLTDYALGNPHRGAVIGRVANRIRDARFVLDGRDVQLAANHGAPSLYGGPTGLHNQVGLRITSTAHR